MTGEAGVDVIRRESDGALYLNANDLLGALRRRITQLSEQAAAAEHPLVKLGLDAAAEALIEHADKLDIALLELLNA